MNTSIANRAAGRPACSVIVLNYNGIEFLENCLRSVLAQDFPGFEVIFVDNGSTDGSADYVRREFPAVRVLEMGANRGYAGGNNAGVSAASGEWIVLLNNDTRVHPGWLAALASAARDPGVAIVSSLVITEGIPDRYYERNGSVNILCQNIMRVFHRPENIFYGGGASLLFKANLLGLPFDEEYFAYLEDVYLAFRARFMGYTVVHTNASVVEHVGSATSMKQPSAFLSYLQERNRILNILLFFSGWTLLRILPFLLLNIPAKCVLGTLSSRHSLPGFLRAYWWLGTHGPDIYRKRGMLRRERRANDREVLSWMTGRLTNGEGVCGRFVNACALSYCRMAGLRTVDFPPASNR